MDQVNEKVPKEPEDELEESVSVQRRLKRLEKENRSLEAYNRDLLGQVKLSTAKLDLAKKYLFQTVAVQTDITIPSSEINGRIFTNVTMVGEETSMDLQSKMKADLDSLLTDIKSGASDDYIYDATSKTYLSRSTGWYYYPESSAFFNPANRSYYRYDASTGKYEFLYTLKEEEKKDSIKKDIDVHTISSTSSPSSDEEEGEIIDISDDDEVESPRPVKRPRSKGIIESRPFLRHEAGSQHRRHRGGGYRDEPDEYEEEARLLARDRGARRTLNHIPPVRLIVQEAEQLDIGSLVMITCLGGKIGQHASCAVTIPDAMVSQLHAEIAYDHQMGSYTVTDLCSRNGTFQNERKIKPLERLPLFHGDILRFSDSVQLLAHIHQHRDFACDDCQPGAMSKKDPNEGIYMANGATTSARAGLKSLKKKYGLAGEQYRETIGPELPPGYRNRAAERQKVVGSDNPYEKTAAGSALDMPLDQRNKGFQMMEKMGWKDGQALGSEEMEGRTEPIELEVRETRMGLGFGSR